MNVTSLNDVEELLPFVRQTPTKGFGDDSKCDSCTFTHIYPTKFLFVHQRVAR